MVGYVQSGWYCLRGLLELIRGVVRVHESLRLVLVDFRFASVPRPALPVGMAGGPDGPCVGVGIGRIVRVVGL